MIFDRNDQSFVARAVDVNRRADLVSSLSLLRGVSAVVAVVSGISALLEFFLEKRAGSAGAVAASAVTFFAISLNTDAQIKAIKLFGKLSPDKQTELSAGR